MLLDEPFSGLDAALRAETRAAVLHALAAQGTTAVLVTHDQAEALSMGREVGVLMAGRLIQTAAPVGALPDAGEPGRGSLRGRGRGRCPDARAGGSSAARWGSSR